METGTPGNATLIGTSFLVVCAHYSGVSILKHNFSKSKKYCEYNKTITNISYYYINS